MSDPQPAAGDPDAEPRSPRPSPAGLPPSALAGMAAPPPPRPSIGSLLFLSALFFFMSGNNHIPENQIIIGPDGTIQPRVTELDRARTYVDEYKGFLNGTGNWTEPLVPDLLPSRLLPPIYEREHGANYWTNITGFYREATAHPVSLLDPAAHRSPFFHHVELPNLNISSWNDTLAQELRGSWDWAKVDKWEMNLKERRVERNASDFAWVRGSATIQAGANSVDYGFYGLHHVPNGTYELYAMPDGKHNDIRNIPSLFPHHLNETRTIILAELEKELQAQKETLLLSDVRPDDTTATSCPLLIHLALPSLPPGVTPVELAMWDEEVQNPTGIGTSLRRPPNYWDGIGLAGVAIADQCGIAFGISGGKGVKIDDFWRKSVNYASYATVTQLLVLVLLVRQMETTRTPSTLAKVSLWTIVFMGIADSWLFSAHVVVGIMSDNRASMPMLIPGFLCLCTAIVFGPAPERVTPAPAPRPLTATPAAGSAESEVTPLASERTAAEPSLTILERIVESFSGNPLYKWLLISVLISLSIIAGSVPGVLPLMLFAAYSFWLPQIWRNARRGTVGALEKSFVIGTSIGRLALPLYAFGCPENVFFVEPSDWVWAVVAWQWFQIMVLFAQDRFGPAFFLPKRFHPAESYNYHPILPTPDEESSSKTSLSETTCSICMEEVDVRPSSSSASAGEAILGLGVRRGYALAPCHHLFHTKCLAQWLAIKTICPLCKRSLPPL